jgi:hypothetical protein
MADKITFETNVWQELRLKWPDGKDLTGAYGPSVMFTTDDGRVMFLPPVAGAKVRALNLQSGEPVNIRKASVNGANGSKPHIEWQVERPAESQQQLFAAPAPESVPAAAVVPPAARIPMNVAFREVLDFVTTGLEESGQEWSDSAIQGVVSTLLAQAGRDGLLGLWERSSN